MCVPAPPPDTGESVRCTEAAFMDVHGRALKGAHGKHNPALQCLSGVATASVSETSKETPTPTGSGRAALAILTNRLPCRG
eukprot:7196045-Prymnesium_polylepis.2